MKWTVAIGVLLVVAAPLASPDGPAWAAVGPGENDFEIDGDYGSTIEANGDITDDGHTSTFVWQGSGKFWEHWIETAYMGSQSYKVRCTASPGPENDRSEQKILQLWTLEDGMRYFSLAFYVPDFAPTPVDFFQFFCQWWQDPDRNPPLQLSWGGDDHLYFARRTEDTGWDCLYDAGVVRRNHWYHLFFAIDFGLDNTGSAYMYEMDPATGLWEEVFGATGITLGWATDPDGSPAETGNFTWKVGTYRGSTPETTRIYYDNVRYARLWRIATKVYLTGYHKNVMRLPFDEGAGTIANDASDYDNDGLLVNGPVWRTGGISGRCLEFDGVDDHVRVAVDEVDFDFGNYLTASGWFRTVHDQTGTSILCMDEYSTSYKFRLYLVSGTSISLDLRYPDNTLQHLIATMPASVFDGRWHHLVGTYNRWAPDGDRLKLYCDGGLVGSMAGEDKPLWRGNNYLYVGKFSGAYFRGCIDEPAVYNYAMTDEEVFQLYGQLSGLDAPDAGAASAREPLSIRPNPCSARAAVTYSIDHARHARLGVYDLAGRERMRLLDGPVSPGQGVVIWDGRDAQGRPVAQGVYLLRLEAGGGTAVQKVAVVR